MSEIKPNTLASLQSVVFPWDKLNIYKKNAKEFCAKASKEFIDLSVGSPVDNVPEGVIKTLQNGSYKSGYPLTSGTANLQQAIVEFMQRNFRVYGLNTENVLPTIGSKEAIGLLPQMLGLGKGDIIVRPKVAYPTYDIGALSCGASVMATDNIADWSGNKGVKLVWLNYPRNPTGECTDTTHLQEVVCAARKIGAIVASDECYAMFDWRRGGLADFGGSATDTVQGADHGAVKDATSACSDTDISSITHPSILSKDVCGGSFDNILMFYSLSKQLNLASFRQAFIAGDSVIMQKLLQIRKHLGLIMPESMQDVMCKALTLSEFTLSQREIYRHRHALLKSGLEGAGYEIEHSVGGLYVWTKARFGSCYDDLEYLATRGIIASPGEFYGEDALNYLRFAITASTLNIQEVVSRLQN